MICYLKWIIFLSYFSLVYTCWFILCLLLLLDSSILVKSLVAFFSECSCIIFQNNRKNKDHSENSSRRYLEFYVQLENKKFLLSQLFCLITKKIPFSICYKTANITASLILKLNIKLWINERKKREKMLFLWNNLINKSSNSQNHILLWFF